MAGMLLLVSGCASHPPRVAKADAFPNDHSLNARARAALYSDPEFKFDGVNVTSYGRTVQLSGFVYTHEQKREAARIVKHVAGVEVVENDISVTGTPTD